MIDNDSIIMIYDFKEGGGIRASAYYLLYAFDESGQLEYESMFDTYEEFIQKRPEDGAFSIGPFEDLNFLNQFAFKVCEKNEAKVVSLLSVREYNQIMENTTTASELFKELSSQGNRIQNLDRESKSGIFGKIFH